ncbi:translation initiation factor eIF-2B subunit delta isoform X2 [Maniola jurtina]|uniref:translation initiation factor eIF-2B subunit delta isoform X2 n=1 Tax=Maniola jurtina TaxID=191418 RepID=UPI001E68A1C4|nr:translation initiation factor eIF-2B subunit delta isoform X2 [Maniola jurtina]
MGLTKEHIQISKEVKPTAITVAQKRRLRRKKLKAARNLTQVNNKTDYQNTPNILNILGIVPKNISPSLCPYAQSNEDKITTEEKIPHSFICSAKAKKDYNMSSKGDTEKSKEVMAARQAKKSSKQKANKKPIESNATPQINVNSPTTKESKTESNDIKNNTNLGSEKPETQNKTSSSSKEQSIVKGRDEVDKAVKIEPELNTEASKDHIKAERAAKKAAKQAKKKGALDSGDSQNIEAKPKEMNKPSTEASKTTKTIDKSKIESIETTEIIGEPKTILKNVDITKTQTELDVKTMPLSEATVKEMVETLKDIVNVAKDVQTVTDKVKAISIGPTKAEESTKSKADLKAERRAKQEAQRAAKQAAQQQKAVEVKKSSKEPSLPKEEKSAKPKAVVDKIKPKSQGMQKMNWFQHLYMEHDKQALKQMQINSNLHPAVIKLGIQLASHVVTGSNARCIALLDALKKMVRDYSLPARTEFARGLESQLAASVEFLWSMRPPAASQTNALKYFRHHLTQLPNNVDEFDAKKRLQEEIDRYIREQIDMAGEAISIAVRNKISTGDNILTYGCSSLIERILCEAHEAGVQFRAVVVGTRVQRGAREMLRRLVSRGVVCTYADITALSFLMRDMSKVLIGAASLLANGAVLAPVGSLQAALVARAHNVPLLVACETHKFSDNVQTDAFVYNEIGDPDDIIDKTDDNSPLKDWRSNPNLTLLNLTYDVTPPSLVTAVVTELAILPCTSAPVVLRFKLSEYGL